MEPGKLNKRIIFLRPDGAEENFLSEAVIRWKPFHPYKEKADDVYLEESRPAGAALVHGDGAVCTDKELAEYAVWAAVEPVTGREYQEAQKIRAETTYNVNTRYFPGIQTDQKIFFRGRVLNIISVLNLGERNREFRIVAADKEADSYGA